MGHQRDPVLPRALDEHVQVGAHKAGRHMVDRVEGALRQDRELADDVVAARHVTADQHEPELLSGLLRDAKADLGDRLLGGDDTEDASRVGRDLPQDLQTLSGERARIHGDAGEVVARRGVAGDQSRLHGVADPGEHDRDRGGRGLGRHRVRGADRDHDVGLRGDERLRLRADIRSHTLGVLEQQDQVAALSIAELVEPLAEPRQDLAEGQARRQHRDPHTAGGRGGVQHGRESYDDGDHPKGRDVTESIAHVSPLRSHRA